MLEENSMWLDKEQAENDPAFKQLIGYCVLTSWNEKIFTYRRAMQDDKYPEKRLQGKWSIGIGGHIEPTDRGEEGIIIKSIKREIHEEIDMDGRIYGQALLGIINDDLNSVGQVHLGLFMIIRTFSVIMFPKDPEIALGALNTREEIIDLFDQQRKNVEEWSLIGFPHIR